MNELSGKVIVNLGDSIFGNFRPPKDVSTFLAEQTGATVYNGGFGGSRMSRNDAVRDPLSMHSLADAIVTGDWSRQETSMRTVNEWCENRVCREYFPKTVALLKSIDFNKVDIVTIAHGTNDFTAECPVFDPADPKGVHSFSGALTHSIEMLREAFPRLEIVLCTPIWRCWLNEELEVIDTAERCVMAGRKLTDIAEQTRKIAREYGLFCIDNYHNSGVGMETRHICFADKDGTHPVEAGRRMIADNMARELIGRYGQ